MAFLGGIQNTILVKIFSKCAQLGYRELSKTYTFYKLLTELDLAHPKNEFEALYMQTCLILSGSGCHSELVSLFLLEDSKEAFKAEMQHGNEGAFKNSLNGSLHTSKLVKELKDVDSFPESELNNFFKEYDSLTRSVATPVDSLLLREQRNTQEDLKSQIATSRSFQENVLSQLELLSTKDDDNSAVEKEYERQIKTIIETMDKGMIQLALDQFSTFKNDVWDKASDLIKYKILTNIGICHFKKNETEEASKALIEAFSFNQESEIAYSNVVNGYVAVNDIENAEKLYSEFSKKFPESPLAVSCYIRLLDKKKDLDKIEKEIPQSLKDNEDVLLALGLHARSIGLFDDAITYLKKAVKNDSGKRNLEEHLLSTILLKYQNDFKIVNLRIIDNKCKEELNEALELSNKLVARYKKGDLAETTGRLLMTKSVLLDLLEDNEQAQEAIDEAIELDSNSPFLLRHKGILLAIKGDFDAAKDVFSKIADYSAIPDTVGLWASILKQKGELNEAIELLEEYIKSDNENIFKSQAEGLLIDIYIESNSLDKVNKYVDEHDSPKTVLDSITLAKAERFLGDVDNGVQRLIKVSSELNPEVSIREKYLLVEELIATENELQAISILEDIADRNVRNVVTTRLINLYYDIGEKGKSLEILKNLRLKNGPLYKSTEFEVSIYQQYHDYETAKAVAQEYLNQFPNELPMKLRLAGINLRLDNYTDVDSFLNEPTDFFHFNQEEFEYYLALLMMRNFRDKVFQTVYQYRRVRNDSTAHILFVKVLLQFPLTKEECTPPETVNVDSVVTLINDSQNNQHFIIENRSKTELFENEINLNDDKYELLKGKRVGEKVTFKSSTVKWTIQSITNKYVFAFNDSQLKNETLYSEHNPFITIHTDDLNDFLDQLEKDDQPWSKNYKKAQQLYSSKRSSIGMIASKLGKSPISIWDEFRSMKDVGIQACNGNNEELEKVFQILDGKPRLCLDVIGLLTVFELELGEHLHKFFGKLIITPSTKDVILDYKQEVGLIIGGPAQANTWFDSLLLFLGNYCEEELPSTIYQMNGQEKERLDELAGVSFIDTIILSKEKEYVFLTDDVLLRKFAEGEYQVKNCWTQSVFRFLFLKKIIDNDLYQEKVIQLARMNYFHTTIDEFTLIAAINKSNSSFDDPITSCLRYLNGDISSEESSILVAIFFLYRIRLGDDFENHNISMLTQVVLSSLCTKRIIIDVINKIESMVIMMHSHKSDIENKRVCQSIFDDIHRWKHVNGVLDTPITSLIKQSKNQDR